MRNVVKLNSNGTLGWSVKRPEQKKWPTVTIDSFFVVFFFFSMGFSEQKSDYHKGKDHQTGWCFFLPSQKPKKKNIFCTTQTTGIESPEVKTKKKWGNVPLLLPYLERKRAAITVYTTTTHCRKLMKQKAHEWQIEKSGN